MMVLIFILYESRVLATYSLRACSVPDYNFVEGEMGEVRKLGRSKFTFRGYERLNEAHTAGAMRKLNNAQGLGGTSPIPFHHVNSLFDASNLYDWRTIKSYYDIIQNIDITRQLELSLYCTSDHLVAKLVIKKRVRVWVWVDPAFHDSQGRLVDVEFGDIKFNSRGQRMRPCVARDIWAFTMVGSGAALGQAHITFCRKYFDWQADKGSERSSNGKGFDVRSIDTIVTQGVSRGYGHNELERIWPKGRIPFHEAVHAVGGPINPTAQAWDANGKILDWAFDFYDSAKLRLRELLIGGDIESLGNADSFTMLALALTLQIERNGIERETWWQFGILDPTTLKPTYSMIEPNPPLTLEQKNDDAYNEISMPYNIYNNLYGRRLNRLPFDIYDDYACPAVQ